MKSSGGKTSSTRSNKRRHEKLRQQGINVSALRKQVDFIDGVTAYVNTRLV